MKNSSQTQVLKLEQQIPNVKLLELENCAKYQQQIGVQQNNLIPSDLKLQQKKADKVYTNIMSQYDLLDFKAIYVKHKSKWAHYTSRFQQKNQAQLKNFFHNSLRRLSSQFIRVEKVNRIFQKSNVSPIFLHNAIDISLYAKSLTDQRNYIITTLSDKILYCLYENSNPEDEELLETCKAVRTIHSYVKHMKIIKKFIQNEEVLRTVALFILKKQQELTKKNNRLFNRESDSSGTLTGKQIQNNEPIERIDMGRIPEYAYYPENYMHYWASIPPMHPASYCYYPEHTFPDMEMAKHEVKTQEQLGMPLQFQNLSPENEGGCKVEG